MTFNYYVGFSAQPKHKVLRVFRIGNNDTPNRQWVIYTRRGIATVCYGITPISWVAGVMRSSWN